ncbi:FUSC family protein [Salipiger bermudensis]|uniref:FUSC family protein n=1 Tax=Salipiger bermudensis TaxID=344736 RepID=UPI001CD3C7BB|nr:FUSC family protein [Salipiger bermudensis]MCA0964421.1 FUSC family protein [Salipiger bermudensis]
MAQPSRVTSWLIDGPRKMGWPDVGIMMLAVGVPPLVAVLVFGPVGMAAFAAAMPAHLAAREGGAPVALLATMVTGLGGMVAIADPVMALMVAGCLAAMTAIAAHRRLARPAMRALLTWTLFTSPLIPADNLPQLFAIYLAGMVWSISVTSLARRVGVPQPSGRVSRVYSFTFGVIFGVGLVSAVWLGQRAFGTHGFWLPLTFVILSMPPYGTLFSRSLIRTLATLLGAAASVALTLLAPPQWLTIALALVCFPISFRFLPRSSFVGTALLTFTILEILSLIADIDVLAVERVETVILASLMTLGLGLVAAGALWLFKREALHDIVGRDQA